MVNRILDDPDANGQFEIPEAGQSTQMVLADSAKPCVQQAVIYIYSDTNWKTQNRQHTATHEFGHALGLDHEYGTGNIMHPYNSGTLKPSSSDTGFAEASRRGQKIVQEHQRMGPKGGTLAFAGVNVRVPPRALTSSVHVGIRPLSPRSAPRPKTAEPGQVMFQSWQIVPEWSPEEVTSGEMYREKSVLLNAPVQLEIQPDPETWKTWLLQHGVQKPDPGDVRLMFFDRERMQWTPIKAVIDLASGTTAAKVSAFGTFALMVRVPEAQESGHVQTESIKTDSLNIKRK